MALQTFTSLRYTPGPCAACCGGTSRHVRLKFVRTSTAGRERPQWHDDRPAWWNAPVGRSWDRRGGGTSKCWEDLDLADLKGEVRTEKARVAESGVTVIKNMVADNSASTGTGGTRGLSVGKFLSLRELFGGSKGSVAGQHKFQEAANKRIWDMNDQLQADVQALALY